MNASEIAERSPAPVGAIPRIVEKLDKARVARAVKHAHQPPNNKEVNAPAYASRYNHRLSCGKRLHIRLWQNKRDRKFYAIVRGYPEVFTGQTRDASFRRLVACHEANRNPASLDKTMVGNEIKKRLVNRRAGALRTTRRQTGRPRARAESRLPLMISEAKSLPTRLLIGKPGKTGVFTA
jgi:hypothetical protein